MQVNWTREKGRLVNKMLVMQACGPKFDPQHPCRKPSMVVPTGDSIASEAYT